MLIARSLLIYLNLKLIIQFKKQFKFNDLKIFINLYIKMKI